LDYADIALTTGFRSKKQWSYVYDERRLSYLVECNTITREISIVSNARRDASTGPGNKVGYFPLLLLVG
jgi:hypothetical protein